MAAFNSIIVVLAAASCFILHSAGQGLSNSGGVSELCLGCICEAVSNCNRSVQCEGNVCGLFKITRGYWLDAGKPVINQDSPENQGAYERCVIEPYCAARTVQGYMAKYRQDCNGDGVIDCNDFAALHRLGGFGCTGSLDFNYQSKFLNCQREVALLNQG